MPPFVAQEPNSECATSTKPAWTCECCQATFTTNECIRVRSAEGELVPVHTCLLGSVEWWYDQKTNRYMLVTPRGVKPGQLPVWWVCRDMNE